ncbi:NADH dehydrogenase [ubiquinone] 1 alpha subcomplex subunit 13 [Hylaeus anthracinus]|uniref:NADH dehydrogenase [ubiquinone] 1 alpha subcomplex subunit 13 n=1 Tax=Hylaeus anthracinus TaxID=313031 RepID=UPI0023B9F02D|nr:NADH dehydrogenase [ubiquinone] 1 alpha subcomplex subunit 13 [Hylaeus anthracinus]
MASTAKMGSQDLPPKGGYAPYQIERINLRTVIGGKTGIALFYAATFGGFYLYYLNHKYVTRNKIEMRSSRLALQPMMEAERDRALMKHMRRLIEEEADVMKNVPGWEVGTFFGEPIYYTVPEDEYIEPLLSDLIVFSNPEDYRIRVSGNLYT